MKVRVLATVILSTLLLLAGVAPVVGVSETPKQRSDSPVHRPAPATGGASADALPEATAHSSTAQQYKVTLDNATIKRWLLRNATVQNATVETLVVQNVTTPNATETNVTLQNVSVGRFFVEKGRLMNVTAESIVVRNKSVLNVPGADLINPTVKDRVIESHTTRNNTVVGIDIDTVVVEAADLRENATIGERATAAANSTNSTNSTNSANSTNSTNSTNSANSTNSTNSTNSANSTAANGAQPDITVQNGTVGLAVVKTGVASEWTVESTEGVNATATGANATTAATANAAATNPTTGGN
ncbi:hypothetical protein [Halorussus halophilus]|uniref:hypothetical protein n=1 Tax=Halorussus halophilus TaxID=2650975 RepID=UPI001787A6F4|nr:hypothetical protein [Halorussus halophilus]